MMRRLAVVLALLSVLASGAAWADDGARALFTTGAAKLKEGRVGEAIAEFEALADRGVVDAAASFDRGLAYAERVRIGAEQPGDLGRAAQGFEEARALAPSGALAKDAAQALRAIRAEVGRRRTRAGDPVDVDATRVGRSIVHLISEDAWCVAAIVASVAIGVGLFFQMLASSRRGKVGGTVAWVVATPLCALCVAMALFARRDRLHLEQAVIVAESARPADDKGVAIPNVKALPEAALVDVVETKPGWARVEWGALGGWIPSTSIRVVAKPE